MSTCLDAAAALSSDVYEPSPSIVTPLRRIARIALTSLPLCVWAQACIMPCGVRQGSRSLAGLEVVGSKLSGGVRAMGHQRQGDGPTSTNAARSLNELEEIFVQTATNAPATVGSLTSLPPPDNDPPGARSPIRAHEITCPRTTGWHTSTKRDSAPAHNEMAHLHIIGQHARRDKLATPCGESTHMHGWYQRWLIEYRVRATDIRGLTSWATPPRTGCKHARGVLVQ
ncbi:hypothetical protein BD779DRAFT_1472401 [Infundibulicybe gibba]|nr:hypothetical protein BD779DRAFT_1472401 [Infundibulicybe gibba]